MLAIEKSLPAKRRVGVCITVDTEFSIGGAFNSPSLGEPLGRKSVLCTVDGQSEGLGFLLRTLEAFGLKATFFVETLNTAYFGYDEMGAIARAISEDGHDTQVHLHPVWHQMFGQGDWRARLKSTEPSDDLRTRTVDQIREYIGVAQRCFQVWGLPPPKALRSGNLVASSNIYEAARVSGLRVASNVALGCGNPPAEPELRRHSAHAIVEGILEVPVTSYRAIGAGGFWSTKALTVMGTSAAEFRQVLARAHENGVRWVVMVTHPFEFVKGFDRRYDGIRRNRINQSRFQAMCRFIKSNPERFEVVTMGEIAEQWDGWAEEDILLTASVPRAIGRLVSNVVNEFVRAF